MVTGIFIGTQPEVAAEISDSNVKVCNDSFIIVNSFLWKDI